MSASAERRVGGGTHVVGIIGWPVAHSLSPAIHNAAFAAEGLDWVYLPLPVRPEWLQPALIGLVPLGLAGANVTMPHKTEAAELIQRCSDDATLLRAVNTIVVRGGELEGHNTDAAGFDRFLRRDAGFDPEGRSALLYGSGGAARACALALARGGLQALTVAARDEVRAAPLVKMVEPLGVSVTLVGPADTERARGRPRGERHSRGRSGTGPQPPQPSAPRPGCPGDRPPVRPGLDRPPASSAGSRRRRVRRPRASARAGRPLFRAVDGSAGAPRSDVGRRSRRFGRQRATPIAASIQASPLHGRCSQEG